MRLHLIIILMQTLVLNIPITFPGGRADPPSSSSKTSEKAHTRTHKHTHTGVYIHLHVL